MFSKSFNSPPDTEYTVFVIGLFDDKSHYPSTYNVLWKKQSYVRRTDNLNLVRRFKKWSDLSLYYHKFDLIYCRRNSREPGAFPNVSLS